MNEKCWIRLSGILLLYEEYHRAVSRSLRKRYELADLRVRNAALLMKLSRKVTFQQAGFISGTRHLAKYGIVSLEAKEE